MATKWSPVILRVNPLSIFWHDTPTFVNTKTAPGFNWLLNWFQTALWIVPLICPVLSASRTVGSGDKQSISFKTETKNGILSVKERPDAVYGRSFCFIHATLYLSNKTSTSVVKKSDRNCWYGDEEKDESFAWVHKF